MRPFSRAQHGLRRDGLPTLSRVPTELGREERRCERCEAVTEHIIYRVPKRVVLIYLKNHPNNLEATCRVCARSTVLAGPERDRIFSERAEAEDTVE